MTQAPPFEEDPPTGGTDCATELRLDIAGFEGPIDVLLQLARDQKVDLTRVSILDLAEQYLGFVREARQLRLELAADYLVMAAWLAYLKSRMLVPEPESDDVEPSGAEMAAALRFQLQRLQAMQDAGKELFARARLGVEVFARGEPEKLPVVTRQHYECTLYDLLKAYAAQRQRGETTRLRVDPMDLESVERALERLRRQLGAVPDWTALMDFLPAGLETGLQRRSARAATFAASLELCREGQVDLRQDSPFGPIFLRPRTPGGTGPTSGDVEDGEP